MVLSTRVLLYEKDLLELAARESLSAAVTEFRGREFVRREDGLRALHADHDWKPARCSAFPLEVYVESGDIGVTVREVAREHCKGLGVSERRVVDNLGAFLSELLWDLEDPITTVEL